MADINLSTVAGSGVGTVTRTAAVMVVSTFGVGTGVLVPRIFSNRWPSSGSDQFRSGVGSASEAPRTPQADNPTKSKAANIKNPKAENPRFSIGNTRFRIIFLPPNDIRMK